MKRPETLSNVKDEEVIAYVGYLEEIITKADPSDLRIIETLNNKAAKLELELGECESDDVKKKCQQLKELTKTIDFYKDRLITEEEVKEEEKKPGPDLGAGYVEKAAKEG